MPLINKCRSCSSNNLELILDLTDTPWCNGFIDKSNISSEKKYPLRLNICNDCQLLQLDFTVPKEVMFSNHTYVSGTTKTLTDHFYNVAKENIQQFNIKESDLIVDIGGNDGTKLLQYQKQTNAKLLNVESASNICKLSIENNIPTICEYFNSSVAENLSNTQKAKLILASGVLFHLEELHSVLDGIKILLQSDGVLVAEFMYAYDMIKNLAFDGIYHEHLCYYTLSSLSTLLDIHGLMIFDAYHSDIHSGSIIAKICHSGMYKTTQRLTDVISIEPKNFKKEAIKFAKKVESKKYELLNMLSDLKKENVNIKIYGYGAPAKSTTLLNYFKIDNKIIDKIVEVNELKVGKVTPGTHIPIELESFGDIPDYYLLLSWNFQQEIINKNKDIINNGCKFIIPFPEIKIIDK
jgi:hypothetical protein